MNRVLAIVVVYNGMRWLSRCLPSLSGTDVFVVDNDSTDGSADWIEANYPSARLLRSAENLGFTEANNLGFRYALEKGYDYVYLINQDAWMEEGALEKLVSAADSAPEYALLSPLQMSDGFKALDVQFAKRCPFKEAEEISPVNFVMAAHWLVRVEALRRIGLFCPLFPLWGQDDNWCHRALFHGWKIGIVSVARAVHDRQGRKEPKTRIMERNYFTGSVVRLCDINRPLFGRKLYVDLFTLVKAVKYRSFKVFSMRRKIRGIDAEICSVRRFTEGEGAYI